MAGNPIDECGQIQGNLSNPKPNKASSYKAILSQALPIPSKEGAETSCEIPGKPSTNPSHNITATT
jgi:hypothetical protein